MLTIKKKKQLLFKPHGSCNFIRKLHRSIKEILPPGFEMRSVRTLAEHLYNNNYDLDYILRKLIGDFELLGRDELINNAADEEMVMYLPQLLIPFKSKDDFVMPHKHLQWMDYFLSEIDEIIVIGWKGSEEKFQQLLKNKLHPKKIKVTTVTFNDHSVIGEFARSIPNATINETGYTFSHFIKTAIEQKRMIFDP